MNLYFPSEFESTDVKDYYDLLKKRTLLKLYSISKKEDNEDKIKEIDLELLLFFKPKIFTGEKSLEIDFDKKFDEMCTFISHKLNLDAGQMTTLSFYNSLDYIKKINKKDGR